MGVGDIKRKRRYNVAPPGKAQNPERAQQESCRRAKARIMDVVRCNDFGYMLTLMQMFLLPHSARKRR